MRCPFCGSEDTQVKDSRPSEDGMSIRRRRYCSKCDSRFTTFERVQIRELTVLKKDGSRRPFDREKLVRSIGIAVRKRPVTQEQVDMMVNTIVHKLESSGETDIATDRIGQLVMEVLAGVDSVAYIRFASVYKQFREASDFGKFVDEIKSLNS